MLYRVGPAAIGQHHALGGDALLLQAQLNHVRTETVIVVHHLTVQALDAFVWVDVTFRVDGVNRTFKSAAATR